MVHAAAASASGRYVARHLDCRHLRLPWQALDLRDDTRNDVVHERLASRAP